MNDRNKVFFNDRILNIYFRIYFNSFSSNKMDIYRLKLCPLNLQQCGRTLLVSQHQHIGSGNGDIKGPPDTT